MKRQNGWIVSVRDQVTMRKLDRLVDSSHSRDSILKHLKYGKGNCQVEESLLGKSGIIGLWDSKRERCDNPFILSSVCIDYWR